MNDSTGAVHEQEKVEAARQSVALVEDGMVLGLGSGSTAALVVRFLGERVKAGLRVRGVPTSSETGRLAMAAGIPLVTLAEAPVLDLTLDGADEVDPDGNLIKGRGGALLHEKILAVHSRRLVIVIDGSKRVDRLGLTAPVPVEVIPLAAPAVAPALAALGSRVVLRRDRQGQTFITDEGNQIFDCDFGAINDAETLAANLDRMVGVVEHGLFLGLAPIIISAATTGSSPR